MRRRIKAAALIAIVFTSLCVATRHTSTYASTVYKLPDNNGFKAYMDYRAITNTASKQYQLAKKCKTDSNGLRTYDDRYAVAIGQGYGAHIGSYIDAKLDTGVTIQCIVGDFKGTDITDKEMHIDINNGSVLEFIVDTPALDSKVKLSGTISTIKGFNGSVKEITVYEDSEDAPKTMRNKGHSEDVLLTVGSGDSTEVVIDVNKAVKSSDVIEEEKKVIKPKKFKTETKASFVEDPYPEYEVEYIVTKKFSQTSKKGTKYFAVYKNGTVEVTKDTFDTLIPNKTTVPVKFLEK